MSYSYENDDSHLEDTSPIPIVSTGEYHSLATGSPVPAWRRGVGVISLIGATLLTVGTAVVLTTAPPTLTPVAPITTLPTLTTRANDLTPFQVTQAPVSETVLESAPDSQRPVVASEVLPTLDPAAAAVLLGQPLQSFSAQADAADIAIVRSSNDPFTFIPDRPRSEVVQYVVKAGDTMFGIAEQFGLEPESIAWSNDRSIIGGLRPGRRINIPPVNGAYYQVISETTIGEIAAQFRVEPSVILDSEYNDLFSASAETTLQSGIWVMIPGGTAEIITWSAPVQRTGSNSQSGGAGAQISFGAGEAGSCGLVDNPGGGAGWARPLANYTWMQGFTSFHTGVDLAASTGTPVYAANSGSVIFAGGSAYGYGIAIVLAHGPYTTVYGHLSGLNVNCRQYVNAGQVIGYVGTTGRSSGPHLHFEIRLNDVPTDPTGTMAF